MAGSRVRVGNVTVQMETVGVLDVLNSPGVRADINRRAAAIASRANAMHDAKGYAVRESRTDRAVAAVVATTQHAINSNAKHNTLLKSLSSGAE